MERSENGAVIPLEMGWRDLGSWAALDATTTKNAEGNAVSGSPELLDVADSFIHCDGTQVAAIGLRDMLVVAVQGQVLIAPKHRAEEIRSVAAQMPKNSRATRTRAHTVHRPWGQFEAMDCGEDYQVKKLTILPQAKISLQTHSQRAEHWVVVKGIATVTRGEQRYELHRNESTYIAVGERHRLENLTDEELIVIEVQTGDYLGEDDIERFEDIYARSAEA
jgi:mannose-1-phosphate guanylyltransferase/mannose-6-phosphate isomerase